MLNHLVPLKKIIENDPMVIAIDLHETLGVRVQVKPDYMFGQTDLLVKARSGKYRYEIMCELKGILFFSLVTVDEMKIYFPHLAEEIA